MIAHSDGGARGNPGPAGYGVVIKDESGRKWPRLSEYLGHQTNNFAEYQGLIAALEYALQHGPKALKLISDSELLVRQIKGIYKVKNAVLAGLTRASERIDRANGLVLHRPRLSRTESGSRPVRQRSHGSRHGKECVARTLLSANAGSATTRQICGRLVRVARAIGANRVYEGVVRNGKMELLSGSLPEGTRVQLRVKK